MRKLVAPLAAAGALLWLPGQAALGKRARAPGPGPPRLPQPTETAH
jgi:hypothetical protein